MKRALFLFLAVSLLIMPALPAAMQSSDPDIPTPFTDTDHDALSDEREAQLGTDPNNPDTDGDGVPDGTEVLLQEVYGINLNPLRRDTLESLVGFQRPDPARARWADRLHDVYDYGLQTRLTEEAWRAWGRTLDIVTTSASVGSLTSTGAPQVQPPSGAPAAPPPAEPCSSEWLRIHGFGRIDSFYTILPGMRDAGTGGALYRTRDGRSTLQVSGAAWEVSNTEAGLVVRNLDPEQGSISVVYRDECRNQNLTISNRPGRAVVLLRGVNAMLTVDAAADTVEVVMTEGTLEIDGTEESFTVPADSESSLVLQVGADGSITSTEIPLDEAIQRFPPLFRSLSFFAQMLIPVPENMDGIDLLAWVVMLDLDSSAATGMTAESTNNRMYTGLGAEAYVPVYLQPDGTLSGEIVFHDGTNEIGRFPVEVELTPNRDGVFIHVPLAVLLEQSAALGSPFAPETLTWRIATVWHSPDGDAKDVFPDFEDE